MPQNVSRPPGRHFLQIPGPTPVPDRVLRAIDMPLIDQRGPEFSKLGKRVLEGIKTIFKTTQPVIIYTATGTGAWEAALSNTLSPGDRVLMVETGQFATLWKVMAERLGLKPEFIKTDWRVGADPKVIEEHLRKDKAQEIKAVCVVHSETATGCMSSIAEIRKAIDAAGHPALLLVDTISSLASTDYRHDEWGVDVSIGGAQKGLMLPPGMSFNAVSEKALRASKTAKLPRSFFQWDDMLTMYKNGYFPYTPATQMLYGLDTSITMLHEEGLDNVFARHDRLAEATRRAVRAWGLEILCRDRRIEKTHDGRDRASRRPTRQVGIRRRRRFFLRRHSAGGHSQPLPAAGAGTAGISEFRAVVCGDSRAACLQGSGRRGEAGVTGHSGAERSEEPGIHIHKRRGY